VSTLLSLVERHATAIAWLLVAVVFALDLLSTGDVVRLLYLAVVLLGLWSSDRWLSLKVAAVATGLSVGHLVAGVEGAESIGSIFVRLKYLHGVWIAAVGVALHRRGTAQREMAQRSLVQSLKDLEDIRNALDQSAIVATTTVRGDITYVNDRFCEISKYSRQELIGQNHRIINSGLHPPEFFRDLWGTIASGKVWHGEIRNRAKDGSFYWVDTTIVPFLDEHGKPYQYIAVRYDITERKRSEAALRQQEALAQLGKMAAVVAHEVRNPLAGIRGAVQVIGRRLPRDSPETAVIDEIVSRIDTLNDIVQDLLLFARPRPLELARVRLRQVVDESIALLREDPRFAGVRVETTVEDATILADPGQLKLVLINLVVNAMQAMGQQGVVRVASHRRGDRQEILVIDNGPGIPADVREHLFEPFYTTKSRGTGLGLATAHRIVASHRGEIRLECPPGGGTTAIVTLPCEVPAGQAPVPTDAPQGLPART
jgi:PAS domain S-box-containing protein